MASEKLKLINFKVNKRESILIRENAKRARMTLSQWLRYAATRVPTPKSKGV